MPKMWLFIINEGASVGFLRVLSRILDAFELAEFNVGINNVQLPIMQKIFRFKTRYKDSMAEENIKSFIQRINLE